MSGAMYLIAVILLYSFIGFAPIAASSYRRRSGRSGYWWLVLMAIVLEISIVLAGISVIGQRDSSTLAIALPLIAAVVAISLYIWLANALDHRERVLRHTNR
jgi:hypothetical protein